MIRFPPDAPPRGDLPWLRRRTVKPPTSGATPPSTMPPAAHSATTAEQPVSPSLDLSAPATALATPKRPARPATPAVPMRRVRARGSQVLSAEDPSVWLTRLQSGIGALTIEAAVSDSAGDLRLGAAYRLRHGTTSVVQHASGVAEGPPRSDRPVLRGTRQRFETVTLDLAQVALLDRLAVYAYSPSGSALAWGGTLIVTTYGGSRVEMPLDGPAGPGVLVVLTAYNVRGELVLRQEPWGLAETVREACLSMGFDKITWLDANNPVI